VTYFNVTSKPAAHDENPGHPEYEVEALTTTPCRGVDRKLRNKTDAAQNMRRRAAGTLV
jgi:hypothetical protein